MADVADLADDVVIISDGCIAAAQPLSELSAAYPSLESAFFALTEPDMAANVPTKVTVNAAATAVEVGKCI
jgi:ABC-type uncharacterized transport system ATPase subunit